MRNQGRGARDCRHDSNILAKDDEARWQAGNFARKREPNGESADKHHGGERGDERGNPAVRDGKSVDCSDGCADEQHGRQAGRDGERMTGQPAFVGAHDFSADHAGQRDDRGDGQINSADDQHERESDGDDENRQRVGNDGLQI